MIENWLDQLLQFWLFKLTVFWIAVDILVIATGWFAVTVIKRRFPQWWKGTVVDTAPPELDKLEEELEAEQTQPAMGQAKTLKS